MDDSLDVLTLLDRVHRAASLPGALSAVAEHARTSWGVERARALSAGEAELRRAAPDGGGEVVVPIPGAAPDAPVGALVLGGGVGAEVLGRVTEALRHAGPALARLAELEELRRAAQGLEQQRHLLTAIVNALPDPVLITDARSHVLLENRRAGGLLTTREGDSEGRRRAVEINNLLLSSFLARSGTEDTASSRELNLVDPSEGADLLFEVLVTPLPDGMAGEGAMVSVLRDVTDLKRAASELEHQFKRMRHAEDKARRERDRLNLILENVGDPILVTDEDANIILMNRQAERLFEVPPGARQDAEWHQEVRANDTKFSSLISDFGLSPDEARVEEMALTDPASRKDLPVEVVSGKILNERSETTAIVSIVHDLTKAVENERLATELTRLNEGLEDRIAAATRELEERNRQLEWQSRELERAYRLKSEFLASMSHELRTPINALLGYTSLMRDRIYGEVTQRQEEALQRMYAASQHLLELVNDILDLAKIEAGKMPVHMEPVEVAGVIEELSQTVDPMVRQKKLEYRADVAPDLPVLETDRTKVKQILLNLLSNAVKFTHEGEVSVVARAAEDGGIEVTVADTGIGIEPEQLEHIFEDFRQVDQSSTREYGGTGLGLSISKKLLVLLGGSIRVDSSPGKGSVFTVRLPRQSPEPEVDEAGRVVMPDDEGVVQVGGALED